MKPMNLPGWIVVCSLTLFGAYGVRGLVTGQDIPGNVQTTLFAVLTGGVLAEPVREGLKKKGKGER